MSTATIDVTLQFRGASAAEWQSANTLLKQREPGYEVDTAKMKIGDGVSRWNDLPYYNDFDPSLYATVSQGALASSALQPGDLATGTITPYDGDLDFSGGLGGGSALENAEDTEDGIFVHDGDGETGGVIKIGGALPAASGTGDLGSSGVRFANAHATYVVPRYLRFRDPSNNIERFQMVSTATGIVTLSWYSSPVGIQLGGTTSSSAMILQDGPEIRIRLADDSGDASLASGPMRVGVYAFASVPTAGDYAGYAIVISDRDYRMATSDGTNWNWAGTTTAIS